MEFLNLVKLLLRFRRGNHFELSRKGASNAPSGMRMKYRIENTDQVLKTVWIMRMRQEAQKYASNMMLMVIEG